MSKPVEKVQTKKEEFYNTFSHAIAIPFGIYALQYLWRNNTEEYFASYLGILLYGISFILLFSASSLYHIITKPSLKKKFRVLDHISIYYLIAGTYSPVVLVVLKESKAWLLFSIVWGIALAGTLLKLFFTGRFEKLSLALYLIMGWLIVLDFSNLIENASILTLTYLGIGGFFYTVGAYFYANNKISFNHVIWHIFVFVAAIFHFLMVAEVVT